MNDILLPLWAEVAIGALTVGGALVALLGSLGLMRLKSYFERVHAPSIVATLGCWLIMWASIIFFSVSSHGFAAHPLLIAVFIAVTVPITTIFLMRAALFRSRRMGRDVPPSVSSIVRNAPLTEEEAALPGKEPAPRDAA